MSLIVCREDSLLSTSGCSRKTRKQTELRLRFPTNVEKKAECPQSNTRYRPDGRYLIALYAGKITVVATHRAGRVLYPMGQSSRPAFFVDTSVCSPIPQG